jgi:peptidoglycan/LPS O-acetylase OafA/YrhL
LIRQALLLRVKVSPSKLTATLATIRNTQLEGWRALAVLGVMGQHWLPANWRGPFPLEIGLFFFLTLTGFLITRILWRDRLTGEMSGKKWRAKAYLHFQKRRMTRILVPCYVAMLFAIAVGAEDIRHHFLAYFGHWVNFHMAMMENWPSGTAHYWTLAIQVQFYLAWPLVVFSVPKRFLTGAFTILAALAPCSRMIIWNGFPEIHHSEAITFTALDYFGIGALLALAMEPGMQAGNVKLKRASVVAGLSYGILYLFSRMGQPIAYFCYIQQTLLSVFFAGLISSTLVGFRGGLGKLLDCAPIQHIGRLSYGLYLFHTPVPLFVGYVMPFLWWPFFSGPWEIIRLIVFALTSWGLAYLCWLHLEKGKPFSNDSGGDSAPSKPKKENGLSRKKAQITQT